MPDIPSGRPVRWAILGTGAVSRKFAHGLAACRPPARLHAVISRDPARGAAFARAFGGAAAVTGPQEAAEAGADALYIATPVSEHAAHARAALAAGLPVLVEKPLAPSADEARAIAEAARAAGLFAAEAVWTRFLPVIDTLRARLAAGALGTPVAFTGSFCLATRPDGRASLFDPARGGGALLHRGLYPLSLAVMALGPVARVQAAGRIGPTGVDEEAQLLLTHAGGAVSHIRASLVADGPNDATLSGTAGTLHLAAPIWRPTGATLAATRPAPPMGGAPPRFEGLRESRAGQRLSRLVLAPARRLRHPPERIAAPWRGNGYTHEAEAVARALAAGRTEAAEMPLDESIAVLAALDAARAALRGGAT